MTNWTLQVIVYCWAAWLVYWLAMALLQRLGRNWSANVAFKQDHELITSGPYSLVRHPIYTGMILMALGTVINLGQALGCPLSLLLCVGMWLKLRREEELMIEH